MELTYPPLPFPTPSWGGGQLKKKHNLWKKIRFKPTTEEPSLGCIKMFLSLYLWICIRHFAESGDQLGEMADHEEKDDGERNPTKAQLSPTQWLVPSPAQCDKPVSEGPVDVGVEPEEEGQGQEVHT